MSIPLVLMVAFAVFFLQQLLCFRCESLIRFVPLAILGVTEMVLWGYFYLVRPGFYAFIVGLIGLYWLGAAALAWVIYGIVQLVQKRRK